MYIGSLLLDGRSVGKGPPQTDGACWKYNNKVRNLPTLLEDKKCSFCFPIKEKRKKYISQTFLIQTLVGPRTKGSLPPSSSIAISKNNIVAPSFLLSFLYLTFVHLLLLAGCYKISPIYSPFLSFPSFFRGSWLLQQADDWRRKKSFQIATDGWQ